MTYANVASSIALFVAVGGGTAVALKGTNTVNSGDIINGKVKSVDLQNNGVSGTDVNEASLTGVLGCGAGFNRIQDVCYETSDRAAVLWNPALLACTSANLRLPSLSEALLMAKDLPTPIVDQNWWTDDVDAVAGTSAGWVAHNDTDGSVSPFKAGNVAGLLFPFRCVKSPGD